MRESSPATLRVLFDGGCPLCRREIALYQRLRPSRPIEWIDIDADRRAAEDAMREMHRLLEVYAEGLARRCLG